MPEAPDLEIVREYLTERMLGKSVLWVKVVRPTVLRSLAGDFQGELAGLTLESIERRGKYLLYGSPGPAAWLSIRCLPGPSSIATKESSSSREAASPWAWRMARS